MALINHVRKVRLRNGMKQIELARAAGMGQSTISDIENGKLIPGVDMALKLAKALRCPVNELFMLENEKER